jgi:predicted nucleic-acid-binding Zn-ribbon protein
MMANGVRKMTTVEESLSQAFQCTKCGHRGARVQRLAMSGTGISRLLEIQPYRFVFVSCRNCGHTEVFDLDVLAGKDDLGTVLEVLFAN